MKNFIFLYLVNLVVIDAFKLLQPITYLDVNNNSIDNIQKLIGDYISDDDDELMGDFNDQLEQALQSDWFDLTLFYYSGIKKNLQAKLRNQNEFQEIASVYRPEFKNVFIIHGWKHKYSEGDWMDDFKNLILHRHTGDANVDIISNIQFVFIVDWSEFSKINYPDAAYFTRTLGNQLSQFISFLRDRFSIDPNNVHLIGHSLGAHSSGFTAKALKKRNIIVGRITGLDPAGPFFSTDDTKQRLDKTDAKFVEVLHSNMANSVSMGEYYQLSKPLLIELMNNIQQSKFYHALKTGLGTTLKIGHVDIFLNGGSRQRGCHSFIKDIDYDHFFTRGFDQLDMINSISRNLDPPQTKKNIRRWSQFLFCDHERAVDFYKETIGSTKTCQALSYQCQSYKEFLGRKCASCGNQNDNCFLLGYHTNLSNEINPSIQSKSYFLLTNTGEPLCAHHYQVRIEIEFSGFKRGVFELKLKGENGENNFELEGEWNSKIFSTIITTEHNLGELLGATGKFQKSWWDLTAHTVILKSMDINYISNMNNTIREKFSAYFDTVEYSDGYIYHFHR